MTFHLKRLRLKRPHLRGEWLLAYALHVVLLLLLLFLVVRDATLVVSGLLALDLLLLLVLVARSRWSAFQALPLALIVLTAPFILFWLAVPRTGVSYLYGVILILAGLILFVIEIVAGATRRDH